MPVVENLQVLVAGDRFILMSQRPCGQQRQKLCRTCINFNFCAFPGMHFSKPVSVSLLLSCAVLQCSKKPVASRLIPSTRGFVFPSSCVINLPKRDGFQKSETTIREQFFFAFGEICSQEISHLEIWKSWELRAKKLALLCKSKKHCSRIENLHYRGKLMDCIKINHQSNYDF